MFRARLSGFWDGNLIDAGAGSEMITTLAHVGDMLLTSSVLPIREVSRTKALVRSAPLDQYCIQVSLAPTGMEVEVEGIESRAAPGQPVFLDLCQPFKTRQGTGRSLQAFVSKPVFHQLFGPCESLHGTSLQGASAAVLVDHLKAVADCLDALPAANAPGLALGTLHLVAGATALARQVRGDDRAKADAALMRQACRLIDERLCDAELTIEQIAGALRISRATLYRLFEEGGGVARHIKERRLERIHAILSAADPQRPCLSSIAEEYGFKSGGDFSRAFLGHFGYRPSEVVPRAASPKGADSGDFASAASHRLGDWLAGG